MAQSLLQLTIANVGSSVFEGEVLSVLLPGSDGVMQILANHEPLISPLQTGEIVIEKQDGTKQTLQIESGVLEISNNHATVLI